MATSRVFKAGNSQAVRIPRALAFDRGISEVNVERRGDALVIRPIKPSSTQLVETIKALTGKAPRRNRPEIDWPDRQRDAGGA
jgi:antitoxin VapB